MVGLVAQYGTKVVIATGPTRKAAEEIALQLFAECGYDLKGIEIPMILFDPTEVGGLIMDPTDPDPFSLDDEYSMDEWSTDGYVGPSQSEG